MESTTHEIVYLSSLITHKEGQARPYQDTDAVILCTSFTVLCYGV